MEIQYKLLVIDIETDGLRPPANILEVGIASLDENLRISEEFSCLIKSKNINKFAWIFDNSDLTYEEIMENGKIWNTVKPTIQQLVNQYPVTAYNCKFDFKFLLHYGIETKEDIKNMIMKLLDYGVDPF